MRNRVLYGSLLCLVAAVSWGAMFPVAHAAFVHIDPFHFTIIRYGAVAVLLMLLLWRKEGSRAFRLEGRGLRLWFYGTMAFTVYNLFIFWGQNLLGEPGVMAASIAESLMPMISILIGWLLLGNRARPFTLLCVLVSLAGALLVITKGDLRAFFAAPGQLIPSLLLFVAVAGWVVYTMGARSFPDWSALRYSTLSCLLGTATAMAVTAGTTLFGYTPVPTAEGLLAAGPHLAFMILFPGLIALVGWNTGVAILSPLNGLLFINFVPVTTLAVSLFQSHALTWQDAAGTGLIVAALLANYFHSRSAGKEAPDGAAGHQETLRSRMSTTG